MFKVLLAVLGLTTAKGALPRPPTAQQWIEGEGLAAEQINELLSSRPAHAPESFDCEVRAFAYTFAQQLQGWRGAKAMKDVHDALELDTLCGSAFDPTGVPPTVEVYAHPDPIPAGSLVAFVNTTSSSMAAAMPGVLGDEHAPFATVHEAVTAIRASRPEATDEGSRAYVILREGIHRVVDTLELGPTDSFITFRNFPGEEASMSGALPLNTAWKPFKVDGGANIYMADLSAQAGALTRGIPGLRVDGHRGVRASYPNRDPELTIFPDGWIHDHTHWSKPIAPKTNETFVTVDKPMLHDKTMFQNYMVGVHGHCSVYDPPVSYWCSEHPSGGGAFSFRVPSALRFSNETALKHWANPEGAIINAWRPAHWANWMFEVDSYDFEARTIGWHKGGYQGARGNNRGGEWYVENVFEELDNPNEYFYNETTHVLYYYHNASGAPPASMHFEAAVNQTLVSLRGTQATPVKGVQFQGITFRDSAYTYMEPHGVPSGGDWGLQRMGALFFEGTEDVQVHRCLVTRVDSNAVMLSGYNRGAHLTDNEFVWIGDSVMASWGYTAPLGGKAGDSILGQYKSGVDGTNGEQPRGTTATGNFIHELGHYEKQSSPWFQAKSAQNNFSGNIFFNMPRAGVNFNDGFGGGSTVANNLGFNTCRESSDHAVFNSWDRQPFLTKIGQTPGVANLNPAYNVIKQNFFIGNYGASMAIDNDDGSSYYEIVENFEVYGGHKSNFGGHNKLRHGAINAFAKVYQDGACCRVNAQNLGNYTDGYYNNTCIQDKDGLVAYTFRYCDPNKPDNVTNLGLLHDNKIYNPSGHVTVQCGKKVMTEAEFQASGADPGTTTHKTPDYSEIIVWAKNMLQQ